MKKKLLSLLVVICVVFSILPQTNPTSNSNNLLLNSTNDNSNDAITLVSSNERSVATYGATTTGGVTVSQASDYPMTTTYIHASYIDTNSGYLYATGYNSGQLGVGHNSNVTSFTAMRMSNDVSKPFVNPVDWSFGADINMGAIIDANGKLWTAGSNQLGALGNGTFGIKEGAPGTASAQYSFEMVESIGGNTNYKAIKAAVNGQGSGNNVLMIMLEDGSLWGAGIGTSMGFTEAEAKAAGGVSRITNPEGGYLAGEPGSGYYFVDFTRLDTKLPEDDNKIKDFKSTVGATYLLTTKGNLYTVGTTTSMMGGASSWTTPKLTNVVQIALKNSSFLVLKNDGSLWVTGNNGYGNLGLGDTTARSVFTQVDTSFLANGEFIVQIDINVYHSGVLTNKGNLYMAGNKPYMGIGVTSGYYYTFTKCHEDVVYFTTGFTYTYIMFKEGNIVGVGTGNYGGLGNGSTGGNVSTPDSPDAGLNPPESAGGGVTGEVTLPTFTPNPETYPQDEYDKLPETEKEELTKPTEPESPGQPDEGGSSSGFEGEDGNNYTFSPPA